MACGERVEQQIRYWGWCRKWKIPYPCRKTKLGIAYQYAFSALRYVPSIVPFWQKRQGCCEGTAYEWKRYVLWNTPKAYDWVPQSPPVVMTFSSRPGSKGACAGQGDGIT